MSKYCVHSSNYWYVYSWCRKCLSSQLRGSPLYCVPLLLSSPSKFNVLQRVVCLAVNPIAVCKLSRLFCLHVDDCLWETKVHLQQRKFLGFFQPSKSYHRFWTILPSIEVEVS